VLTADAEHIDRWRGLADMLLTKQNEFRKQVTKNEGFAPKSADKAPMLDLIAELRQDPAALNALVEIRALPDPRYSDDDWARVRDVAQVWCSPRRNWTRCFASRARWTFPPSRWPRCARSAAADAPTDLNLRLDYRLQHHLGR
jgi:ATP-dependent helicase/nuclease subunit A